MALGKIHHYLFTYFPTNILDLEVVVEVVLVHHVSLVRNIVIVVEVPMIAMTIAVVKIMMANTVVIIDDDEYCFFPNYLY